MQNAICSMTATASAAVCTAVAFAAHFGLVGLPSPPLFVLAAFLLAVSITTSKRLSGVAFSFWVGAFVTFSMFYPQYFSAWGSYETKRLIVPLIQLIMFGMGTMLSLADFARVLQMPKAVLVGIVLQFAVMPTLGAILAKAFGFPPEVAAGVVLIGACPGGVASNVMTYLARGNVALSVTMTACSTMVSPFVTPYAMHFLAGQYISIDIGDMMMGILEMVIAPIVLGLVVNYVLNHYQLRGVWMDKLLSFIAMSGICLIIAIITSLSRDRLLSVGIALIAAAIIHNGLGYMFGYYGAMLAGLPESDRRTVAIEVGLQNGGMASGLAVNVLGNADAAL
ncbi:MAG: bile acid:sodium symporter family protein, partial [Planctomycetales bacterium]|nr:bile acid:sodium symporter family protein [Planctomycetales bacterium]